MYSYEQPSKTRFKKKPIIMLGLLFVLIIGLIVIITSNGTRQNTKTSTISQEDAEHKKQLAILNSIEIDGLSPLQTNILTLIKQEFTKRPKSYDNTVLKYTEGFKESWCADFVSWIMNKAGSPNTNPETGYWRIPGVLSMINYYKGIDGYTTTDSNYSPRLGDVVFYIGEETPDGSSGEHMAFVLSFDGKKLITIGGNEGDGIMQVRSESIDTNLKKGLIGYGMLE